MANHAMVNLDKVLAEQNGNVESVQHTADMDNGCVVMLGAFVTGERELRQVVTPVTATITTDEVLLVKSPEVLYLPGQTLKDFYNPANKPARALHLEVGDIFTVTTDGITGTPVVGQYLIPANNSLKLAAAADLTGGTRFAAKVLEIGSFGYTGTGTAKQQSVTVQVVKR